MPRRLVPTLPVALSLLPVAALLGTGLYLLKLERASVDRQARENCSLAAEILHQEILAEILDLTGDLASDPPLLSDTPFTTFVLSENGQLLSPRPYPEVPPTSIGSVALSGLVEASHGEEPQGGGTELQGDSAGENDSRPLSPAGIPLRPLAAFNRLRALDGAPEGTPEALQEARLDLAAAAVESPSRFSPLFFDAAEPDSGEAKRRWAADETSRAIARKVAGRISLNRGDLPSPPLAGWVEVDREDWLLLHHEEEGNIRFHALGAPLVSRALLSATRSLSASLPNYATPTVTVAGRPFNRTPQDDLVLLASFSKPAPSSSVPPAAITFHLSSPDALLSLYRKKVPWIIGVIAIASTASLVGLFLSSTALQRMRRLHAEKDHFIANVTHELRTPITTVQVIAENLSEGRVREAPRMQDCFLSIRQECGRLSSLIENVLTFSRLESGSAWSPEMEDTDLNQLVQCATDTLGPKADAKGTELQFKDGTHGASAEADPVSLSRAVTNLIDNAIAYSPEGARVTTGVTQDGAWFELWVEDDGDTIPPDEREKVFERFFRRQTERTIEHKGAGIGLSIVRHIAESHGGSISVSGASSPTGNRFTIRIPSSTPEPQ